LALRLARQVRRRCGHGTRVEGLGERLLPSEGQEGQGRILKRVFYQSAHCAVLCHERSRTYRWRKRAEGKGHSRVVIALARRRVNVLWAMLRDGTYYENRMPLAA
jgi:transposase